MSRWSDTSSRASRLEPPFAELMAFPGGELVARGLSDARAGHDSIAALVVSLAATRLRMVGLDLPNTLGVEGGEGVEDGELELYARLGELDDPYGRYNALRRELTSFLDAYEAHVARRVRSRDCSRDAR